MVDATVSTEILGSKLLNNYTFAGKNNNGTVEASTNVKIVLPATTTTLTNCNFSIERSTSISNQVSVWLNDENKPLVTVMPTLVTDITNLRTCTAIVCKTVINVIDNNGKVLNKKELYLPVGSTTFTISDCKKIFAGIHHL